MEIWIDTTGGVNGGHWTLINQIDDTPGLTADAPVCAPSRLVRQ